MDGRGQIRGDKLKLQRERIEDGGEGVEEILDGELRELRARPTRVVPFAGTRRRHPFASVHRTLRVLNAAEIAIGTIERQRTSGDRLDDAVEGAEDSRAAIERAEAEGASGIEGEGAAMVTGGLALVVAAAPRTACGDIAAWSLVGFDEVAETFWHGLGTPLVDTQVLCFEIFAT